MMTGARVLWLSTRSVRLIGVAAVLAAATVLAAQSRPGAGGRPPEFVFTRIRYGGGVDGFGYRGGGNSWNHDYPRGDEHISLLISEITKTVVGTLGTNVFRLDEDQLFRYPVAYISEPGFWTMTESEAASVREYVLKGGFLIFDDFEGEQLNNLVAQLHRVLPEYRPIKIDVSHPIFHTFFDMTTIDFPHPLVNVMPVYYGLFENNDPNDTMVAIINHNNDIAEYWEWSGTGFFPVDTSNEAYKLGVNYIIYGLTH